MFYQQDVAGHQMRTRNPRELVVGKVPRLDTEDHADRAALHMPDPKGRMQFDVRKEALGILGVVGEDRRTELDFPSRFVNALAHFQRHGMRQFFGPVVHESGSFGDNDRPLGIALALPGLEAFGSGRELLFELLVGELVELLEQRASGGIEALIGHDVVFFPTLSYGLADNPVAVIATPR